MLRRAFTSPLARTSAAATAAASTAAKFAATSQLCTGQRGWAYKPRTREYQFVMEEVFGFYKHYEAMGKSEDWNKDSVDQLFEAATTLTTQQLVPLYSSGDLEGCKLKDGLVTTPKGFKEAYKSFVEGGWCGINFPTENGGLGAPPSTGIFLREIFATGNWSFSMYPGLSAGAAQTLLEHGNKEQKERYLTKLVSGEWSGTMCLTEPHCGTDLAQCKTKAEPQADGTYKVTGTKIFISSGDHDLADNIVHIVLAKLPDAPSGTKGISLFLIPRHVVKADGTLEAKKNITCVRLENKMGIHGNATCQLAFDNSVAYLIGKPHDGMRQMFTFMNTARVGTAMQGIAHAELAFQGARAYAAERGSMRSISGTKNPERANDLIIHHPPVKNMVLFGKAISEAGRCLIGEMAMILDRYTAAKNEEERAVWDEKLGILTPIAKAALTELGLEAASHACQVYGGHGYIRENLVEQNLRDARISTLYEGTTQIQALDLIGRKVMLSKKNELGKFQQKVISLAMQNVMDTGILGMNSRALLKAAINWRCAPLLLKLMAAKNRDAVANSAVDFTMYSGYVVLGYYWLRMATVAKKKVDKKEDPDGFYQQKIDTCDYYFNYIFPRVRTHGRQMFNDPKILDRIKNDNLFNF
jgi:alkylation response protein AidB-like acyl-CoA dehydrogenase